MFLSSLAVAIFKNSRRMGEKEERSTAIHISVPRKVKKQNDISPETTSNQNSFFKKKKRDKFKAILKYLKKKCYRSLDI